LVKVNITDFRNEMKKKMSKNMMTEEKEKKELAIKFWNQFCEDVYNNVNASEIELEDLSELEFKIFCVKKLDGIVNIDLLAHPDFPDLMSKIYPKWKNIEVSYNEDFDKFRDVFIEEMLGLPKNWRKYL